MSLSSALETSPGTVAAPDDSPRVLRDVPFAAYRSMPGVNWSSLKHLRSSPLHYLTALRAEHEPSAAMRIGSLAHAMILEPAEEVARRFRVWDGRRAGKEWERFECDAKADGCEVLNAREESEAAAIAAAVRGHAVASGMLAEVLDAEVSIAWRANGTGCKARVDAVTPTALIDIKTTANLDPGIFGAAFVRAGYHNQLAWYVDGWAAATGETLDPYVIAVESGSPHDVVVYSVPEHVIALGRKENARLLRTLAECQASGAWPGRQSGIVELPVPEYVLGNELGITIAGEEV